MLIWVVIAENNLRSGFEVATAFGYSTIFAALALKANGGIIRTLDCYVEESREDYRYSATEVCDAVQQVRANVAAGVLPRGLQQAMNAAQATGVESAVSFNVGMSPADVPQIVGSAAIDYVLIDGGHFGDQPTQDFNAVRPYLASRCAVLFHDNNDNPSVADAIRKAERAVGGKAHRFNSRYGLTLVGRGIGASSVAICDRLCVRNSRRTFGQRVLGRLARLCGRPQG